MVAEPDTEPKVFISSTGEDLGEYRKAVRDAVMSLGCAPRMYEYWPARGDTQPYDVCMERVRQADVLVVIVAHRYGWVPPDQPEGGEKSITWLECDEARRKDIEVLPFMVDPAAPWPFEQREYARTQEAIQRGVSDKELQELNQEVTRNARLLEQFKAELSTLACRKIFTSEDALTKEVTASLADWQKRRFGDRPDSAGQAAVRRAGYLDWIKRTCERIDLLGMELKDQHAVRLGQVYVPAVTQRTIRKDDLDTGEDWRPERERGEALLIDRLGEESLYVPGAPGAGKSVFCSWVALSVARGEVPAHPIEPPDAYVEALPAGLRDRMPVLCRLRELAGLPECIQGGGEWAARELVSALACWMDQKQYGGLLGKDLEDAISAGRALLILDGVDELPEQLETPSGLCRPRANLISGLADALPGWQAAGNRVLLTSRPYGMGSGDRGRVGVTEAALADLPPDLQTLFVRRWYAVADPADADAKARGLLADLQGRPNDVAELVRSPLLLTALCIKYDEGQQLPEDIYELYDTLVDLVLHKRYPTRNDRNAARLRLEAVAFGMHTGDAVGVARDTPQPEVSFDELECILAEHAQQNRATEGTAVDMAERRDDLISRSGLLLARGDNRAAFYHLTFQEFLASRYALRSRTDLAELLDERVDLSGWGRTFSFLFCGIAENNPQAALEWLGHLATSLTPDHNLARWASTQVLAECLELAYRWGYHVDTFRPGFEALCQAALDPATDPGQRAQLWRVLGFVGWDSRSGVGLRPDGVPDIDWVEVPEGPFISGRGESPREETLPSFRIARYPVTNGQFQAFIDEGGYADDRWWIHLAAESIVVRTPEAGPWTEPNRPRVSVSWYEAMAFCSWLSSKLGDTVRLPTELEWEKAARGTDGRLYPWGNEYVAGNANVNETYGDAGPHYLGEATPVGIYPKDYSPFGVADLSGNVCEWCHNRAGNSDRVDPGGAGFRALCGGSCGHSMASVRAFSDGSHPHERGADWGFRLLSLPPDSTEH